MMLFNRPFGDYWQFVKPGVWLLALVSIVRFLLLPVFGVPYEQGTHYASVTILQALLIVYFSIRAVGYFTGYKDILAIALVLGLFSAAFIVLGIAIDEFAGIQTYYTDPAHGGQINPVGHMGAHIGGGFIFSLILWGLGSLTYFITSKVGKKAVA